ncbi:hypothetical protein P7C70_g522, partial [Phenoliferia sp. Uapishka_3]
MAPEQGIETGSTAANSTPQSEEHGLVNPTLSSIVLRFEAGMQRYSRAFQESDEAGYELAEETLGVVKKALAEAIAFAAAEVTKKGGDGSCDQIEKLLDDVVDFEQRAVDAAYGNSHEWGLGYDSERASMCDFMGSYTEPVALAPLGGAPGFPLKSICFFWRRLERSSGGGWKDRTPILRIYGTSFTSADVGPADQGPSVGLADTPREIVLDGQDDLVAITDNSRIKTYRGDLPVHTMASGKLEGPMAFIDVGRKLVKACSRKNYVKVWDLAGLPTHGRSGAKLLGGKIKGEINTWRDDADDDEEIERSKGVTATSKITLNSSIRGISSWTPLCGSTNFICTSSGSERQSSGSETFELDFTTGQKCMRRSPAPTITFAVHNAEEPAYGSAFANIGGQPFVFTGGIKSEQISTWDARSPGRALYSLATGNNAVQSMAWQVSSQSLWAATECLYVDRMGNHHGYRHAKIPRTQINAEASPSDDDKSSADDEDYSVDDNDYEHNWPRGAFHDEQAFGHAFDSGTHRLFRFAFKDQADPTVLPEWGQSSVGGDSSYY